MVRFSGLGIRHQLSLNISSTICFWRIILSPLLIVTDRCLFLASSRLLPGRASPDESRAKRVGDVLLRISLRLTSVFGAEFCHLESFLSSLGQLSYTRQVLPYWVGWLGGCRFESLFFVLT